jgi:hypothetical protein
VSRLWIAVRYLAIAVAVIGLADFFWFWGESVIRFGSSDALANGSVDGGHYYIYEKARGALVEVTQADWNWSRVHALSVQITFPFALAGMLVLGWLNRRESRSRATHERP